jgi:uncharacterized protein YoxC
MKGASMGHVAGLIAAIAFAVMSIFTAILLYQLVKTMGIINLFINDIRVETTMDHVNNELDRVDGILTAVESMSEKANNATKVVQEVVTSPIVKAIGIGAGAGKAYSRWKRK